MAIYELDIVSFRGHAINDGTEYRAYWADENSGNPLNGPAGTAVESERPGSFPVYVRTQPDGQRPVIDIELIGGFDQDGLDLLKQWFSILDDEGYLVATDGNSTERRMRCSVTRIELIQANILRAYLRSSDGVWEATTQQDDTEVITADGQTFDLVNGGTAPAYPRFTLTPNTQMSHDDSYIHRRRVWIANRSPYEVGDPIGDGYPIDLASASLDTAALTTAKMLASGDDLRVVLAGEEIYRWLDNMDAASTKVWCNLRFQPAKTFTLAAAMASGSAPGEGDRFSVDNPEGLAGWPESCFVFVESEVMQLIKVDGFTWEVARRGVGGTTAAAHSAGVVGYWIEHPWLDVIYDFTAAADPDPIDDRKPVISLSNSTNGKHVWAGPFLNDDDRRSRALQRRFLREGAASDYVRCYESGGVLIFEDAAAVAGKPRFNNVVIDCPIPIDDAAAAVELDYTVQNNMRLFAFLIDPGGFESELFNQRPTTALTNQQYAPAGLSRQLRLNGRIGAVAGVFRAAGDAIALSETPQDFCLSFELDEETDISGVVLYCLRVSGSGNVQATLLSDVSGLPDSNLANALRAFVITPPTGSAAYVIGQTTSTPPTVVALPAGRYHICFEKLTGTDVINIYKSQGKPNARQHRTSGTAATLAESILARVLAHSAPAQYDTARETQEKVQIDNLELTYASEYLPLLTLAAEEDMYLHNFTLRNNTTGQWLRVFLPARVGAESVYIDCKARQIIDQESGLPVPFALVASDPDWMHLVPGTNELQYDEDGVTSVDVAWAFVEEYL